MEKFYDYVVSLFYHDVFVCKKGVADVESIGNYLILSIQREVRPAKDCVFDFF